MHSDNYSLWAVIGDELMLLSQATRQIFTSAYSVGLLLIK